MRCFGLSSSISRTPLVKAILYAASSAVAAAVVAGSSAARAAAPEFLTADSAPEAAAVTLLAVGDNQTKAGPPVRAVDSDGNTLTYSISDADAGSGHAGLFTIDSATGQILRKVGTNRGVYRVRVSVSDDGFDTDDSDTATVDVTIHVTSAGQSWHESHWYPSSSMTAGDGSANDWFGVSVDADDEVIVVGAPFGDPSGGVTPTRSGDWGGGMAGPGAAYVFDADSGAQVARLDSPNAEDGGWFGWEVELVGDLIFVAAKNENSGVGRVYVFTKPATGWADTSTVAATLAPDSTLAAMRNTLGTVGIQFGTGLSVSGDGNTVAVGATHWEYVGDSSDRADIDRDGAVFVFTKPATGWADADTDDTGVVKLFAGSRVRRYDQFGNTIAVSSDGATIAVAAPFGWDAEGWVYMFTRPDGGWADTAFTDTPPRLSVEGRHRQQRLGQKGLGISADGSTVVAGGPVSWRKGQADDSQIPADAVGAAYVFVRPADGWADATETAKLTKFGHKYDEFGSAIAVSASGNKIAVGNTDSRSSNYRGAAYVYTKPAGGGLG